MTKTYTEDTFVICHNNGEVVHPLKAIAGTCLSTGQPNVEEFATEEEWKARLKELNYDMTRLDPPSPDALKGANPGKLPAGASLRGPNERRIGRLGFDPQEMRAKMATLSPEERKAERMKLRDERRTARMAARAARPGAPAPEAPPAPPANPA